MRRMLLVLIGLLTLQVSSVLFGKLFWLNLADSEPMGLYRLEAYRVGIRRGDLVIMQVPAPFRSYVYGRGWLPYGWALVKEVGALSGDLVCVQGSFFSINGIRMGPMYRTDRQGLPLPCLKGCWSVPDQHFLPVALRIDRSFDGRYMGPVPVSDIKGLAKPILTF